MNKMKIREIFNKPKIIGIVANVNQGKSNLIYYTIAELQKEGKFDLYTYGLRCNIPIAKAINSVQEMESVRNSILVIDEMFNLFDLDNRKVKAQIENTLRLINHNNNILVLCGVGENYKKFLSSKLDVIIYKKINFADLINGSRVKNVILNYKGEEAGSTLLNLPIDEALVFDGLHYQKIKVPYQQEQDSKANNEQIIKSVTVSVRKNVPQNVQKRN